MTWSYLRGEEGGDRGDTEEEAKEHVLDHSDISLNYSEVHLTG